MIVRMKNTFRMLLAAMLLSLFALPGYSWQKSFPEKDYVAYLFTYFTGNSGDEEAVRYAVSMDGYTYWALNDNEPVIDSKVISSTGGVRDPHILRCEDGKTFYMVVTDMVSANGWSSNRAMVLLKSTDLVNWSHSVINIQKRYSGQEDLKRVWAPQTIYDPEVGKYMVYWSMLHGDGADVIYYAYANAEFTDLEGEPKPLFLPENGKSCIDGDIVYKDGVFHLFYKTEGHGNGIKVATTRSLTSGAWTEEPDYKQQTKEAVEGAGTFKLIGQDKYILMYDVYMKGSYQFTETTDLKNFKVIDSEVKMNFHPRHGTIIPITRHELLRITDEWGKPTELGALPNNPVLPGFHADPEILYSHQTQKYYIYSTTDGQPGWGGWYFTVFSSTDLKTWQDEGVMLDLKSEQVPWADGNAWAPCIEEKKVDGKYVYDESATSDAEQQQNAKTVTIAVLCTTFAVLIAVTVVLCVVNRCKKQNVVYKEQTAFCRADIYVYFAVATLVVLLFVACARPVGQVAATVKAVDMESGKTLFAYDIANGKWQTFDEGGITCEVVQNGQSLTVTVNRGTDGKYNTFEIVPASNGVNVTMKAAECGVHKDCIRVFGTISAGSIVCSPNMLKVIVE